jgi:hypothetical protein
LFSEPPLLAVTDSWFGNAGLLKPVRQVIGERFDMLSRLRCNNVLYDFPEPRKSGQRGRRKSVSINPSDRCRHHAEVQMIGDRLSCTALTFLTPHILL